MDWDVQKITVYIAVCRNCGDFAPDWGWTERKAIERAEEFGWADGICERCWEASWEASLDSG